VEFRTKWWDLRLGGRRTGVVPRPIKAIEIYLPLDYNDGRPIEAAKYVRLEDELLEHFGGVTSTQRLFPLRGLWQSGRQVFQDRVVVFGVMDFSASTEFGRVRYLERLKARLKRKFAQLEVLITVQELVAI
jgi:hypothetical protein